MLAISLRLKFVHIFHQVTITLCPNEMIHLHQVYFNVLSLHLLPILNLSLGLETMPAEVYLQAKL